MQPFSAVGPPCNSIQGPLQQCCQKPFCVSEGTVLVCSGCRDPRPRQEAETAHVAFLTALETRPLEMSVSAGLPSPQGSLLGL